MNQVGWGNPLILIPTWIGWNVVIMFTKNIKKNKWAVDTCIKCDVLDHLGYKECTDNSETESIREKATVPITLKTVDMYKQPRRVQ